MAVSSSTVNVYQYSFVLTGLAGVGKSTIFNYVKQCETTRTGKPVELTHSDGPEVGVDCCVYSTTVKGTRFKISLYDTGGLERYASLTSNYYHRCNAVILVYLNDADRLDTLTRLNSCIESAIKYNRHQDLLVFTLWGNDSTDSSGNNVHESVRIHAKAFMDTFEIPSKLHFSVCSQNGKGILEAMESLIWAVHSSFKGSLCNFTTREVVDSLDSAGSTEHGRLVNNRVEAFQLMSEEEENRENRQLSNIKKKTKCCLKQ